MPPIVPRGPTFLKATQFIKNPIPILDEHIEKYGDSYTFFMGGLKKSIVTSDPAFIQYVLQKGHRKYEKSEIQTDILSQYIGHGLLTAKGEYWLRQRRLIQPGFHRERINELSELMIEETIDYFDKLSAKSGQVVDLYAEMNTLTFRLVARTLFSSSIDEHGLEELSSLISTVQSFIIREVRQPYLKWWFQWSGLIRKHIKLAHESFEIIGTLIDDRKASGEKHGDLLDMLMSSRYEDTDDGMTRQQLIEECLILFVAGHETSANALGWMAYALAKHPEVLKKTRTEVQNIIGEGPIQTGHISQLDYCKQVIEETLRMYPPAWVTDRVSKEADEFDGFSFPANTIIIVYLYGLHHNPKYWNDPNLFQPERFSEANRKEFPSQAYKPFGGGPRLCIGNHFALMEMQVIVAELVRRFEWELIDEEIEMAPMITLRPDGGVKVKLNVRKPH